MKKFLIKTFGKIKTHTFFKYIIVNLTVICFGIFVNPAKAQALTSTITVQLKNVRLDDFFLEIEKKTDYVFFYKTDVDISQKVSVSAENEALTTILNRTFIPLNLKYRVKGNQITVAADEKAGKTGRKETQSPQQQDGRTVTGAIFDENGETIAGATVTIKGSTRGVITGSNGKFTIEVNPTDVLEINFIGYQPRSILVGEQRNFDIRLEPKANELDEVTIVAFGKQKKSSVVASIESVRMSDLKIPSSNLTSAFAGRIPGIISYQTTGEPGADNAQFFVRGVTTFGYKKDPLILIDGFEATANDLARIQPDDIESFSVLKDASATSLYGARGANGIILVNTKAGMEGDVKISARLDVNMSTPTRMIDLVDGVS
jgi:TonB-dependent SusC/RagA subfamily outer membrane receptor